MKKIVYTLLMVFMMSSHLSADDYDLFIGVDGGLSTAAFTNVDGEYKNKDISTYGVKVGAINNKSRVYLSYQYFDAFEGSSVRDGQYQSATISTEGFSNPYNIFDAIDHIFFIGGHLGGINIAVDSSFGTSDAYGVLYGIQGGILTTLGSVASVEFGYRVSLSNFSDQNNDLDKLEVFYTGINIRF